MKWGICRRENIVFPHMNVVHNITYSKRGDKELLDRILARLHLEQYTNTRPVIYPGGEQQRVALGRALYAKPCIFALR